MNKPLFGDITSKVNKDIINLGNQRTILPVSDIFNLNLEFSPIMNFKVTISNTNSKTFKITNVALGFVQITVEFLYSAGATINFPSGVIWKDNTPPSFVVGKRYYLNFLSSNGGVTWDATFSGGFSQLIYDNLFTNAIMSGITGWTGTGGTLSAANGILTLASNGSTSSPRPSQAPINYTEGKKIYIRFTFSESIAGTIVSACLNATGMTMVTGNLQVSPESGVEYTKSVVLTTTAGGSGLLTIEMRCIYTTPAASNGALITLKNPMAIDLSADGLTGWSKDELDTLPFVA